MVIVAIAPFVIGIPMIVWLGPDYSQITGFVFVSVFFVANVVNKIGFMYQRTRTLASIGFSKTFVRLEKRRMIHKAWLEPAAWVLFLLVIVLPLGP